MYTPFDRTRVVLRRCAVVIAGITCLPTLIVPPMASRVYSHLHQVWLKDSTKPVWLAESEKAGGFF
ncbi:DUF2517 family protein [Salinivibrio sharmensis]|uniref:DUF2517 domain-containing protein n=1 Tax=Salinivibrio sharmensis TaxID=390883 RepID=A0ABX3KKZ0_9GAMM|nr:DUF2517 family protein [Salinivibrio sharmensis]OOE90803.1 hypothetical protein BZG74_00775 [Salinivibrio sharmensis]